MERLTMLGIALPDTNRNMERGFVDSYVAMKKPNHCYLRPSTGGPIDTVRNELVSQALSVNCTHILFLDTDQVYPQDLIQRMAIHKLPIVAAKVHRRYPPFDPILFRGPNPYSLRAIPDDDWKNGGCIEVDATGMGCALIDMEVFRAISQPWFSFNYEGPKPVGEDIGFWFKAKAAGYRVFVDCSVKIGHLATMTVTEESYFALKRAQQANEVKK